MIRKIKAFIATLALALFGVAAPVFAQEGTGTDETMETTATETDEKQKGRPERLEEYKEQRKLQLAEFKKTRLANRCKGSQGKIASFKGRINNAVANRTKVYREIGEKLDRLIPKLQAANVDTAALETAREDMQVQLDELTQKLTDYETVLADLSEMDCASDPEAFQAALETARELTKELRAEAKEFRRFITSELRNILKEIRAGLVGESDGTEEENEEETENEDGTETEDETETENGDETDTSETDETDNTNESEGGEQ